MSHKSNYNKGFTLVELIVVLVILAILMAVLIPALLGWIDKARDQQDRVQAENYRKAAQAVLTELYGSGELPNYEHRNYQVTNSNTSAYSWKNDYRFTMLEEYVDEDLSRSGPYILMFRVGRYPVYGESDAHKAYTCYGVVYQRTATSKPVILENDQFYDYYPYPNGDYGQSVDGTMKIVTYAVQSGSNSNPATAYGEVKSNIAK
ncbi:MAG: type II secretion system GspH family protein [Butyrivibrio sp.]|nr:type II secretion system GspH family protein [Butyrivibrio sp.]